MNLKKVIVLAVLMISDAALLGMECNHQDLFVTLKMTQLAFYESLCIRQRLENAMLKEKTALELSAYLQEDVPPILARLNALDPHSCTSEELSAIAASSDVVQRKFFQNHSFYESYRELTIKSEELRIQWVKLAAAIDPIKVTSSSLINDLDQVIQANSQKFSELSSASPHFDLIKQCATLAALVKKGRELNDAFFLRTANPAASSRTNVENMGPSSSSSSSK